MRAWGTKGKEGGVRVPLKIAPIYRQSLPTPPTVCDRRRRPVMQLKENVGTDMRDSSSNDMQVEQPTSVTESLPQTRLCDMPAPPSPRSPTAAGPSSASFVDMQGTACDEHLAVDPPVAPSAIKQEEEATNPEGAAKPVDHTTLAKARGIRVPAELASTSIK
eukprot:2116023-Rhodomonas_salina.1